MQKFLVVGCGGSGAATQAFMIDQLKASLRLIAPEINKLPKAWQFVTIDVPLEPEPGPNGLPNVPQAGGRYVGIGSTQPYSQFDRGLSDNLGRKGALGEIATWASRDPDNLNVPISDGAGQYRGIGRALALQRLSEIRDTLQQAVTDLVDSDANRELDELNRRITGKDSSSADSTPIVLVISSMAGGAGASMFLDVCRILSSIDNVSVGHTAVFLCTPEVFEQRPKSERLGTWPNALAVFGEAVAAQTGSAFGHDQAVFNARGFGGTTQGRSFARLFPIGARMGTKAARFGDGSQQAIYRGLGRALAGLMSSDEASKSFSAYALTNTGALAADRSVFGWGSQTALNWDDMPWGSMGYAQLSMGRDRYAEYAAQRLARSAFERLRTGHYDPSQPSTGQEQLDQRISQRLRYFLDSCLALGNFLDSSPDDYFFTGWIEQLFGSSSGYSHVSVGTDEIKNLVRSVVYAQDGMKSQEWRDAAISGLQGVSEEVIGRCRSAAYSAVFSVADALADRLVVTVENELSLYGLPYARKLVENLRSGLREQVLPPLRRFGAPVSQGRNPMALTPQAEQILQPLTGKGTVKNGAQLTDQLLAAMIPSWEDYLRRCIALQLEELLVDYCDNLLGPLGRELEAAHEDLDEAANKRETLLNLADVSTDNPLAWPADGEEKVNDRFRGSANEIVITSVDRFPRDYGQHMLQTVRVSTPDVVTSDQAVHAATGVVIRGEWETQGSRPAPRDTLALPMRSESGGGNRVGWVPSSLLSYPESSGPREPREARAASFRAKVRPRDLIERARQWIMRPKYPFEMFINVDLRHFLTRSSDLSDAEYNTRRNALRDAFKEALLQARPLAAVSESALSRAHPGESLRYHYNFSEIPFKDMPVADDLDQALHESLNLDSSTVDVFRRALKSSEKVHRIEVFGSYPNYSPLVFSSVLPKAAEDWDSRIGAKEGFWSLRRARPLAAALPMGQEERRAMVAGWMVGALTGRIAILNQGSAEASAVIFDKEQGKWRPFPKPMLTPPAQLRIAPDWLPAVMESILLAYARFPEKGEDNEVGSSLKPYQVLRGIYDSNPDGPTPAHGIVTHPVVEVLAEYLATGQRHDGVQAPETLQGRFEAVQSGLAEMARNADFFLPNTNAGLPTSFNDPKPVAVVRDRNIAKTMPFYRDLAPDVAAMAEELQKRLQQAVKRAETWGQNSNQMASGPQPGEATINAHMPDFGSGLA
ncbi:tubulin-like doman-containing protein [Corynebacterium heidelbergense]|uniref:Tubulin-like protein n=1 Tax=Corynebacterium heidelbergense TaxID=2055947 RepID=A0A364V8X6_9CORY|nr:tubulin-like doman-containing protein [Corynebacterium heidelbergense]RAV33068.1 hypothetical protein DLJ54_00535 [Corynebacterium heidelbergense]